jgi:hypothetical protein
MPYQIRTNSIVYRCLLAVGILGTVTACTNTQPSTKPYLSTAISDTYVPEYADGLKIVCQMPERADIASALDVFLVVANCGNTPVCFNEGSEIIDPHLLFRRLGSKDWVQSNGSVVASPFVPLGGLCLSRNFLVGLEPREGRVYQKILDLTELEPGNYEVAIVKRDVIFKSKACTPLVLCWFGKIELCRL